MFGGFYSVVVTEQGKENHDPNIFVFSFESHGRCETPQRFVLKKWVKEKAYVIFKKNNQYGFVWFGMYEGFYLGNERSDSYCKIMSGGFEGIQDTTLTGKSEGGPFGPFHHCTRLVAIQLE